MEKNLSEKNVEELYKTADSRMTGSEGITAVLLSKSMIQSANTIASLGKTMVSASTITKDAIEGLSNKINEMIISNNRHSKIMAWLTGTIAFSAIVQLYLSWN